MSKMTAGLFCVYCLDETVHTIIYINNSIHNCKCENCNHVIEYKMDVKEEFYKEMYLRISTKPKKILQEYKQNPKFIIQLPIRTITKPYRFLHDINKSRKVIEQLKNK